MGKTMKTIRAVACAMFLWVSLAHAQSKPGIVVPWEVDTPPGSDPFYALRAKQALSASDLHSIEYLPKLSVLCKKWAIGPYGHGRTNYKSLKV